MDNLNAVNVTVLIDDDHKQDLDKVGNDLRKQGFVVDQVLQEIGVLTGSVPAGAIGTLASIPGVVSVEEERTDYRPSA